ncbi:hypothetical protein BGZ92_005280 [Podila epicladia]|nr:hypothetical protein BGZ92_005280 [Podila epicladia]
MFDDRHRPESSMVRPAPFQGNGHHQGHPQGNNQGNYQGNHPGIHQGNQGNHQINHNYNKNNNNNQGSDQPQAKPGHHPRSGPGPRPFYNGRGGGAIRRGGFRDQRPYRRDDNRGYQRHDQRPNDPHPPTDNHHHMSRPHAQREQHWRDNRGPPPSHHNDQSMNHPPHGRNSASVSNIFDYAKNMHWDQTQDHHSGPPSRPPSGPSGTQAGGPQGRPFGPGPKGPRSPPRQMAPNGPNQTPPTWPNGPEARRPNDRSGPQDRWQRDSLKPQHAKSNAGNYGSTQRERGHFNQGEALGPPNGSSRGPKPFREKQNSTTHTNQSPQPPQPPQPLQPPQPPQPAQPYTVQGYAYPPEGYSQSYSSDPSSYTTPGYPTAHQATAAPVSVTQAQAQAQAYAAAYQTYASGYQAPPTAYCQQPAYPTTTAYQGTRPHRTQPTQDMTTAQHTLRQPILHHFQLQVLPMLP